MTDGAAPWPPATTRAAEQSDAQSNDRNTKRIVDLIVSGGQTGVDRAALDVALAAGIKSGGWIPRGRRAEDGPLPACYPMRETHGRDYAERTRLNVRDSDGTLILCRGAPSGGTRLTEILAARARRPYLIVDLRTTIDPARVCRWLACQHIRVLNVAGPRESGCPGIYAQARAFLERLLDETGSS